MEELNTSSPEEQIAKLKEALRLAELRADLYDEIINVAEAKFKINIRKKLDPSNVQPLTCSP